MKKKNRSIIFFLFLFFPYLVQSEPLKRQILGLYAGSECDELAFHPLHLYAELPLNHLGFVLKYHDIEKGFPDQFEIAKSSGIVTWFLNGRLKDPLAYIKWAISVIESGTKFLILGNIGIEDSLSSQSTSINQINMLLNGLGIDRKDVWINSHQIDQFRLQSSSIVNFERHFDHMAKGFHLQNLTASKGESLVSVTLKDGLTSDLVVITPKGGIATEGYFLSLSEEKEGLNNHEGGGSKSPKVVSQWYLDPFQFFAEVFQSNPFPKPDVTTLCGNRLYFNHVDGTGWNVPTEIELYKKDKPSSFEVIFQEIINKHPELPITIGPIMGDLDPKWAGTLKSQELAKKVFALDHVAVASNSYTYPERTDYFEKADSVEVEKKDSLRGIATRLFRQNPFNYKQEFQGSIDYIKSFIPQGKELKMYLWPGNCLPSQKDLEAVEKLGLHNLNGGRNRFDSEYPSYSSLSAFARQMGPYLQIYAAGDNENSYTYGWKERFFGLKLVTTTLINTDRPIRVKPINLYYTALSGLKRSSMIAIEEVMDYLKNASIIPVFASVYSQIVQGFYRAEFESLDPYSWAVKNRGSLQTIRFDKASLLKLDLSKSKGVMGGRHVQGALYVALDPSFETPIITLTETQKLELPASASVPYLIESHWPISDWNNTSQMLSFQLDGFGSGFLGIYCPLEGEYQIDINGQTQKISTKENQLKFWLDFSGKAKGTVKITQLQQGGGSL